MSNNCGVKEVGKNLSTFDMLPYSVYIRDVDGEFHQVQVLSMNDKYIQTRLITNDGNKAVKVY